MGFSNRLLAIAAIAAAGLAVSACVPTYGIGDNGYYDENGVWYDSARYPDSGYYVNGRYYPAGAYQDGSYYANGQYHAASAYDPNYANGYYYDGGTWFYPVLTQRTYFVYDRDDDDRYRRHKDGRREGRRRDHDGDGKHDGKHDRKWRGEKSGAENAAYRPGRDGGSAGGGTNGGGSGQPQVTAEVPTPVEVTPAPEPVVQETSAEPAQPVHGRGDDTRQDFEN